MASTDGTAILLSVFYLYVVTLSLDARAQRSSGYVHDMAIPWTMMHKRPSIPMSSTAYVLYSSMYRVSSERTCECACSPHCEADLSLSDVGVNTDASYILSSTCVVLGLVAGRQDCQPRLHSQQQTLKRFAAAVEVSNSTHQWHDVIISIKMHVKTFSCTAQPDTTSYDCT